MRVQNKLLIATLALVVILIAVTGLLFYVYSESTCLERSATQMEALADAISLRMESRVQQMDFSLLFMLSQPDFLAAISYYTMPGRDDEANRLLISESAAVISRVMINYALNKSFYRASLFTMRGDYFSSRYLEASLSEKSVIKRLEGIPWTKTAQSLYGRALLLKPYADPWQDEGASVYGVVRAICTTSGRACFIEIQNEVRELDEMLEAAKPFNAKTALIYDDGSVFYAPDGDMGEDDIIASVPVEGYALSVMVWQSREVALGVLIPIENQVFTLCAVALILSAAYLYFASYRLTRPLSAILTSMNQTALDTLNNPPLYAGKDELQALNEAFSRLCERLKNAVDAQLISQERETRARFDSLQAQIDPHFLYNTLNVIAGRAMVIGDDDIVSTCEEIASMLRYSTDTKNRSSTIGHEAEHIRTYLALMKKRYKQKLNYSVDISPDIVNEPMPKIVLQQFAENAIHHGFADSSTLCIDVSGWVAGDCWIIEISDDGKGFDADVLKKLNEVMASRDPKPDGDGLSIGGMGIVNTYLRLRAFYSESFVMKLESDGSGAVIRLSAKRTEKKP